MSQTVLSIASIEAESKIAAVEIMVGVESSTHQAIYLALQEAYRAMREYFETFDSEVNSGVLQEPFLSTIKGGMIVKAGRLDKAAAALQKAIADKGGNYIPPNSNGRIGENEIV